MPELWGSTKWDPHYEADKWAALFWIAVGALVGLVAGMIMWKVFK